MRIGIIGAAGGQGQKFLKLQAECDVSYLIYDHHGETEKAIDVNCFQVTKCIENLLSCQGIIIATPNESHMQYIEYLISKNYEGYIYCEKPPVSSAKDLRRLENMDGFLKKEYCLGSIWNAVYIGKFWTGHIRLDDYYIAIL